MSAIAIVGLACRYPDADTPEKLWRNVLHQRRAFRRIPPERLRLEDYLAEAGDASDSIYSTQAALIEGYEFDRVRFRIGGRVFRATDMAHWLALDMADRALADAGFAGGEGLPRRTTGVLVGNTLTGELSRANSLRLRWPYVRRQVAAALAAEAWSEDRRREFLARLEASYKAPFPETNDESLAGGLANTIAGRICNHFDLHGGGYTVDGACASSLLAVANACAALASGEVDAALAGGVDLSLDPFELVGFARTGALAAGEMRVFDRRPTGFIPGEGCGFAVLMRREEALARKLRVYALIRGWGVSSDGSGGLTRPEVEGQVLALERAYRRAGFGIDSVALFEAHGTGTAVGDATELAALQRARGDAALPAAAVGSIKANIGHTKAAAGAAALIKATLAIHHRMLPPATGCVDPHPLLTDAGSTLRVLRRPAPWPEDLAPKAGVSAMGFGGINCHLALEGAGRRQRISTGEQPFFPAPQDAELLLLAAASEAELCTRAEELERLAPRLSRAEVGDLAAMLARSLPATGKVRAAVVAASPRELSDRLTRLRDRLRCGGIAGSHVNDLDSAGGVFIGRGDEAPRLGFLFPGQGSEVHAGGGLWRRRFAAVDAIYSRAALPAGSGGADTALAQPALAAASLAGLEVLGELGIEATVGVGHSLGELVALSWAGCFAGPTLMRLAGTRGRVMADLGEPGGAMAGIAAGTAEVAELLPGLDEEEIFITGHNAPRQTVIAGPRRAVEAALAAAREKGWRATLLDVSQAFHTPQMAPAAAALAAALRAAPIAALDATARRVCSTVSGDWLTAADDPRALLERQVTSPVRFAEALTKAAPEVDLFLEVGPGSILSDLARQSIAVPAISLDAGGSSLCGLLQAAGALFALGARISPDVLFDDRFTRRFDPERELRFLSNPCELAPVDAVFAPASAPPASSESIPVGADPEQVAGADSPLEVVRRLIARRSELPPEAVSEHNRLLGDLHLSSIAVGELLIEAAGELSLPPPVAPTEYADATVGEMARALDELAEGAASEDGGETGLDTLPAGVDSWVRAFTVVRRQLRPLPAPEPGDGAGGWQIFAPGDRPLGEELRRAFRDAGGRGVVLYLPPDEELHLERLLTAARAALASRRDQPGGTFVLAHHGGGAAAFARSLYLETPEVAMAVIELPPLPAAEAGAWSRRLAAEARAASGYTEVLYGLGGERYQPVLRPLPDVPPAEHAPVLAAGDVLLVTGGGKGIGAECALALARSSGCDLALLGRSSPGEDPELGANLERMAALGVHCRYFRADVTNRTQVRTAVAKAEVAHGPIRAVLHSAGRNRPRLVSDLEPADLKATLAPKVAGLRHLLAAVDPGRLKLLIGFGSLIAHSGLRGEADYALANAELRRTIERFAGEHPGCRCLCVEWSVWSGVGMGARLGRLDALARQGITAITPEDGVAMLEELLARPTPISVVVAGRFGDSPTLELDRPELPLSRFVERPRVHFPGIELVADSVLSSDTDPYLADHVFRDERLFPAVVGLEAMAQAACAVTGRSSPPIFRRIRFDRPIVVPAGESVVVRVATLVRPGDRVEVALRCDRTRFLVDHFHAVCDFSGEPGRGETASGAGAGDVASTLPLDPMADLYGSILFQSGRFRRLRSYRRLSATECQAEISTRDDGWFSSFLPADLRLGDPGARDAAIHAVQACIPHATVLPLGVERLEPGRIHGGTSSPLWVSARERSREGKNLIYDLEIRDSRGALVERWRGLALRVVEETSRPPLLAPPLWGPYLERRLPELVPGAAPRVAVERDGDRQVGRDRAVGRILGAGAAILHRPDGKPEVAGGGAVSVAYSGDKVLAVTGREPLGCDLEVVRERSDTVWLDLLGAERHRLGRLLALEHDEDPDAAATRVWAASESLKKAGRGPDAPLTLSGGSAGGWVLLASGPLIVATVLLPESTGERCALAVLAAPGADPER